MKRIPTELKCDRTTNRAFVRYSGRKIYFGQFGSTKATAAFAKWLAQVIKEPSRIIPSDRLTVGQCVEHYLGAAQQYYSKDGQPTQEFTNIRAAMTNLLEFAGTERDLAIEFGPRRLAALQQSLADRVGDNGKQVYSRKTINARIHRVRRCFRWCAAQELVPPTLVTSLEMITGLRKGRTNARETSRVGCVPIDVVTNTIPFMSPTVASMVKVQLLCGMRPQDVCGMIGQGLDRTDDIWIYRPADHKTAHLDHDLVKAVPKAAMEILTPLLREDPLEPIFSTCDSLNYWRDLERKAPRKTSSSKRPKPRRRYTTGSYGKSITYAIARAKKNGVTIPHWSPNQLRHTIATYLRRVAGVEASQLFLGHSKVDTTLIYAEKSIESLTSIAKLVSPFDVVKVEQKPK